MKALVTGSNGFIGSFLVEKLIATNYEVRCLVRQTSNRRWLNGLDVEFYYGELRDETSLKGAVNDVGIVYHLAGVTRGLREQDYMEGNYKATKNLLSACMQSEHELKFVYVSSQSAGGPSLSNESLTEEQAQHPISMYGRSKYMAEQAVLEFAKTRPATILRPPSVYGPRDVDFLTLFKSARSGFLPVMGKGEQKISIVHVADAVDGILLAGTQSKANGELFFITSDEDVRYSELLHTISETMGVKTRLVPLPYAIVKTVAAASTAASFISKKPTILNMDKYKEMRQAAWLCSNQKAKRVLGFQPKIQLEEGMRQTAEWYKTLGWI